MTTDPLQAAAPADHDTDTESSGGRTAVLRGAARRRTEARGARTAAKWPIAALNGALAVGPHSHTVSPALRSVLRWPAAVVLFACGVIHIPTHLAGLRSGDYAETLSAAVTVLCLLGAAWLAMRDTLVIWAAVAGLAVGVIALHAVASAGTVELLNSSLGDSITWTKATAVLTAATVVLLSGSALFRVGRRGS